MGLEGVRENFVKELDDSQWGKRFDFLFFTFLLNISFKIITFLIGIGSNMKKLYELGKFL